MMAKATATAILIMENKISRVYAAPPTERSKAFYNTPPSKYETVDQVRMYNRLFVIFIEEFRVLIVSGFSRDVS